MPVAQAAGLVIAAELHSLVSETASHVSECLRHSLGTQSTDVPYAITGGVKQILRVVDERRKKSCRDEKLKLKPQ